MKNGEYEGYPIVPIEQVASKIGVFKPETEERVHTLKIFDFIQSGEFIVKYPEIAVWKIDNATLFL